MLCFFLRYVFFYFTYTEIFCLGSPPTSDCLLMYTFKKMLLAAFFFFGLVKPLLLDFSIFIGIL